MAKAKTKTGKPVIFNSRFNFDNLQAFDSPDEIVYILGLVENLNAIDEDDEWMDCILQVEKENFIAMLRQWLILKGDYYESYSRPGTIWCKCTSIYVRTIKETDYDSGYAHQFPHHPDAYTPMNVFNIQTFEFKFTKRKQRVN